MTLDKALRQLKTWAGQPDVYIIGNEVAAVILPHVEEQAREIAELKRRVESAGKSAHMHRKDADALRARAEAAERLNATLLQQRNEARAQARCRKCGGSTYIVVNEEPKQ